MIWCKTNNVETLKNITRSIERMYNQPEKLMVLVDEFNLDMLEYIIKSKSGLQITYILTDSPVVRMHFKYSSRIYPLRANIRSLLRHDVVDEILCCLTCMPKPVSDEVVNICRQYGVSLLIPEYGNFPGLKVQRTQYIGKHKMLVMETNPRKTYGYLYKTLWETSFAALALLLMSPLFIAIAVAIKLTGRGPVFFKQLRVGLRGRKFYIYKFRTMVANAEQLKASLKDMNEADGPAFKMKNDPRITPIGRLLRKTAMDELPQLLNVVKGEMSLIGPRPLVPNEASAHEEWHLKRLSIKPGITCTWQMIPERNSVTFDQWMELDKHYVENWSIFYDVRIFLGTIRSFFLAKGI